MEETGINKKDLELLKEINKIKYWRTIRLIKLSIAIGLILSIAWFAYVNYLYASDIRQYRAEYGDLWGCYLCGYENLRKCECYYTQNKININEEFKTNLGINNVKECISYVETAPLQDLENFSFFKE